MAINHMLSLNKSKTQFRLSKIIKCARIDHVIHSIACSLKIMSVASQLCDDRLSHDIFDILSIDYMDKTFVSTIVDLIPKFEDTMIHCKFFDKWDDCDKFLFPTITEEGMCYSFNSLPLDELSTDE